jgi:hypothetical protein
MVYRIVTTAFDNKVRWMDGWMDRYIERYVEIDRLDR